MIYIYKVDEWLTEKDHLSISIFSFNFRKERGKFSNAHLAMDNILMEMEHEEPVTALGFFVVNRSTVCDNISNLVTFLIALLQFN